MPMIRNQRRLTLFSPFFYTQGLTNSSFVSIKLFCLARTILTGKVALVLKSASDRDRLDGTTFKCLNIGFGILLAGSSFTFCDVGRKGMGALAALLSAVTFKNADLDVSELLKAASSKLSSKYD